MNFNFFNIEIEFDFNSKVIIIYLILSLIACFLNYITRGRSNKLLFENYRSSPLNPLTYLRLFTHSIGHSNWDHLVSNFLYILLIGPILEEKYGSFNLLCMLLITSLIVALFNLVFNNYSICGASSNVFMLIVLSSFTNITEGKIPLTLVLICLFYVVDEIKKGLGEGNRKVYHSGHLIGAIMGIVFGFLSLYNINLLFFLS